MFNLFAQFKALLPNNALQVGNVLDVSGSIVTVELPGGGILQVKGTASVGQRVFVRDNTIEGIAPVLPIVQIEI